MLDGPTLESWIQKLGLSYQKVDDETFVIERGSSNTGVTLSGPVIIAYARVSEIPASNREEFYKRLLELNEKETRVAKFCLDSKKGYATVEWIGLRDNTDEEEFQLGLDTVTELADKYDDVLHDEFF